jgi:hypothetical protein
MLAAVIDEEEIVTNIIVVNSIDVLPGLIDGEGASIGDMWDGVSFTAPPPTPPIVPDRIPMLNAHLVMIDAGWMDQVNAYINSIPGTNGAKVRAYLDKALTMERDHQLVKAIPAALGKTEADVDQLFILASTLNV